MIAKLSITAGVLLLAASQAHAITDGNSLLDHGLCYEKVNVGKADDHPTVMRGGAFIGYLNGAADTLVSYDEAVQYPENMKIGQLCDIVLKYLKDHPEQRHLKAGEVVRLALINAFGARRQ